jgi:hypothetical protein
MFLSFGTNSSRDLADDQDAMLIDGRKDIVQDQGRNYRARHAHPDDDFPDDDAPDDDVTDESAEAVADAVEAVPDATVVAAADEWIEPEDFRFAARPYTWTRGRTRPVQDLSLETLVSTMDMGRHLTTCYSAEHTAIAALCADVRSVAEVAALLALPLGVARVLLADMIDNGWMYVHHNPMGSENVPGLPLMERVLAGLHRL